MKPSRTQNSARDSVTNGEKDGPRAGQNRRRTGTRYEQRAADYLRAQGIRILEQNFRCRDGEIDLIGRDGRYLVFVEVKYRRNRAKGDPSEAVNGPKQQRIRRVARVYLYRHRYGADMPCRFDVVSILDGEIRWIQDAF